MRDRSRSATGSVESGKRSKPCLFDEQTMEQQMLQEQMPQQPLRLPGRERFSSCNFPLKETLIYFYNFK